MEEKSEYHYRMYCFAERHLSPLDKGIQSAHSIIEYGNKYNDASDEYSIWSNRDKTIIVLNGGTVNDLKKLNSELSAKGIPHSLFIEEDLGDAMTCISVLVDDRVFDKNKYPDFNSDTAILSFCLTTYNERYNRWLNSIGGEKNAYLRNLLSKYQLAR